MERSTFTAKSAAVLAAVICMLLLTGCGSTKLSEDFKEDEVKSAAENVITLVNNQDSEGLKAICTVQMKDALTDDVMKQIYEAIGEGGTFEKVSDMSVSGSTANGEDFAVAVVKAKYEIRSFTYTISFTKQMKLAGLYYK
ncbi:MAG: DUF3887 domain-containing protein [Eubacteriales bacterium]